MKSQWIETTLGEVVELKRGYDLPSQDRRPGTVPIVTSSGISDYHAEAKVVGPGVVTGRYGTLGNVYFIEEDYWPHNTTLYVRDFKGNHPRFISYFLRTLPYLSYSDKAAVPGINRNHLHQALVTIPPLPEQRAIAAVLGALDDKIELNRRMNATLEGLARALFRSWFVDFDPVRAKMDRRHNVGAGLVPAQEGAAQEGNHKGLPLPPAIDALFPDEMEVGEDGGERPRGWGTEALSQHITATKGISYKGDYLTIKDAGLPMHNLNSVFEGGGYKHEGLKWYAGEYKDRHVLKPGDLIVTNTEQGFEHLLIGYSAIVPQRYGDKGLFSHHIYRVLFKEESSLRPSYLYYLLRTPIFHDTVSGYTNGTTVNMLPSDGLQKPTIVVPPEAILNHFYAFAEPILERIESIYDENLSLAALRDGLLPKLMAGEVRVRPVEEGIANAL